MLNIVIPMAGAGSRFALAGYTTPKPLIPIHGVEMIRLVIENLRPQCDHRFIFICQREHVDAYGLAEKLANWAPGSALVLLDGLTKGAACTVLAAKTLIDNNDALMIANSDQYVDADINDYLHKISSENLDGLIMTMTASDQKWSFVGLSGDGYVNNVVEKQVISDQATVGIYNFKHGCDFVRAADTMIAKNLHVNGEFYVAPVYNQLIQEAHKIGVYNVGSEFSGMYGLGIPADLEKFLALTLSHRATRGLS